MRIRARKAMLFALTLSSIWAAVPALANDGAASVGVGGIQLKREARISMEQERLTISGEQVTVEYEFLNNTAEDITTEVAFPVPSYDEHYLDASFNKRLDDFQVWIEGQQTMYQTDVKAMLNGIDYSGLLQKLGVDVASLGHFDFRDGRTDPYSPDVEKLLPAQRDELRQLGLIRSDNGFMGWTVVKTYHWTQVFPAHKILHVRHVYAPILGYGGLQPEVVFPISRREMTPEFAAAVRDSCIDATLQKTLAAAAEKEKKEEGGYIRSKWVDYILTTANKWTTPIKEFELIVERPTQQPPAANQWFVSFCWDGPVKRLDTNHFMARSTNFVPKKELHIGFFGIQ